MGLTQTDLQHLQRCLELAREALADGDEPFGSVLVDSSGQMVFEEFEIARWAAGHLTPGDRREATVYTSGEHCPMCSAAHAWVGLGRIVFAVSSQQLGQWLAEWGIAPAPVAALPIQSVAPGIDVVGPAAELAEEMRELHRRFNLG